MKRISDREVEGNEITFKRLTGLLEGFFLRRPESQDIVSCYKGREAMILRGIGEEEGCAAEDAKTRG